MNIGDRFGKVVVQSIQGKKVHVQCDCGVEYWLGKRYLQRRGETQCKSCGWASHRSCQIGNRYDHLVVKELKSEDKHLWAICECDCGNIITTRADVLRKNKTNSCGCMPGVHWKGFGGVSLTYYHRLKANAVVRGLSFDVTIQELWELLVKQDHKCVISGLPIKLSLQTIKQSTASVDRIDSSVGYQVGNIQWVHRDINRMKLNHPQDYFLDLCRCVADFQRGLEISIPPVVSQENQTILVKRGKR